ncbi:N-methylhydantoinase A/oxoprolinase/acetone carboxylase beta subunit [Balamuthia mandrillaris]
MERHPTTVGQTTNGNAIIGVDVGGTNTDAVVLVGREVVASVKQPTTKDVTSGVTSALSQVLASSKLSSSDISVVIIGTTHFVNAVVQRSKELRKVAVLRLCGPASRAIPPFGDFPADLREVVYGYHAFLSGGYEFDGQEIEAISEEEVKQHCEKIKELGLNEIVISGVFSPSNPTHELVKVGQLVHQHLPRARITLSHQVAQLGILCRENAAILNASIRPLAIKTVSAFRSALLQAGLASSSTTLFLTQNDGTVISAEDVVDFPVFTFASGPTNSMRGAAFLTGLKEAIVVDIGGTTSDFGVLVGGFPRPASVAVEVGEVLTNFQMPDVFSVGLGGGSIIKRSKDGSTVESIGPESVGYQLTSKALLFGGDVLTTSDIAAALGWWPSSSPSSELEAQGREKIETLSKNVELLESVRRMINQKLEEGIDAMKTSQQAQPVIVVGGGSVLVPSSSSQGCCLEGASEVIKPNHYAVANAIGAAIAQVSGSIDVVVRLDKNKKEGAERKGNEEEDGDTEKEEFCFTNRETAIKELMAKAKSRAIENGAKEDSLEVLEVAEVPLAYTKGDLLRVKIKVVGDLDLETFCLRRQSNKEAEKKENGTEEEGEQEEETEEAKDEAKKEGDQKKKQKRSVKEYKPLIEVNEEKGYKEWIIGEEDIEFIATGAGIFGTGGGGNPYQAKARLLNHLRNQDADRRHRMRVISPHSLKDSEYVVACGFMGAPTVMLEKMSSGHEVSNSVKALQNLNKDIAAILVAEVGGLNALEPLLTAAITGIPLVDADTMGRAFPQLQMNTPSIYGHPLTPTALADEKGNQLVLTAAKDTSWVEKLLRTATVQFGCIAGIACNLLNGATLRRTCVLHSVSAAWHLGRTVHLAREEKRDVIEAITSSPKFSAVLLFRGKITDVQRRTQAGFALGTITIEGLNEEGSPFKGRSVQVDFQNENLLVRDNEDGKLLAVVPDLISILDSLTGENVFTEDVRYGLRVSVLAQPANPLLTTAEGLQVVGPAAFGYDADKVDYRPIAPFPSPSSLFE